jgi:membrane protein YqaA with SNARE-associated domain
MKSIAQILLAWGLPGTLLIGIIDGAGLPNPSGPDIALILYASQRPENAFLAAVLAVLGSLIGSAVLFLLARKGGEMFLERHTVSPRGKRWRRWFQNYGLITVFIPGLIPIPMPLKIAVVCSGALGISLRSFLAVLAAARIPRYLAIAYLGRRLGEESFEYLKHHKWDFALIALGLFVFSLLLVKASDHLRTGRSASVPRA